MIRIVTGPPGSGKSYYFVKYLSKFVKHDKFYDSLQLDSDVMVVTNVDGIKVSHMQVKEFFEMGLMNVDNVRRYMEERHFKRLIFCCDEAGNFFDKNTTKEQFFFFEYHRHIGVDIFLLCHGFSELPKRLVELAEYCIKALPSSFGFIGFRYNFVDFRSDNTIFTKTLSRDPNVFRLYRSMELDEVVKPKKFLVRKLVFAFGSAFLMFSYMFYFIHNGFHFLPQKSKKYEAIASTSVPVGVGDSPSTSVPGGSLLSSSDEALLRPEYLEMPAAAAEHIYPSQLIAGTVVCGDRAFVLYRKEPEADDENTSQEVAKGVDLPSIGGEIAN